MIFLEFLGLEIGGYLLIRYAKWIVDSTERLDFAERWFGPTGTYTLYKMIGVLIMFFGFYILVH